MRPRCLLPISLVLAALSASCGSDATGTFVRLSFSGSVSQEAPIETIAVDLKLGANTASTAFQASDQGGIKLPTDSILEIGSGEGLLTVAARALSKAGIVLGTGAGSGTVVRGQTVDIDIDFGIPTVDAGLDAGSDGPGLPIDATLDAIDGNPGADQAPDVPGPIDGPSLIDVSGAIDGGVPDASLADAPLPDVPGRDRPADTGGAPGTGGAGGGTGGGSGVGGSTGGTSGTYRLNVSPPSIDFGTVAPNTTSPVQSLTVSNTGDAPTPRLVLSISDPKNFAVKADTCNGAVLYPGGTCTTSFVFAPSMSGAFHADGSLAPVTGMGVKFQLSGTGASGPVTLTLSPPTADLGQVDVGASAEVAFTLTNGGEVSAGTVAVQLNGPSAFQIASNGCANIPLGPRGQCTFTVVFKPTAFGPASATVSVQFSTGTTSATVSAVARDFVPLKIDFSGKGVGTVTGGPEVCPSSGPCTFDIPRTDPSNIPRFLLIAEPTAPSFFTGWDGACTGKGSCSVSMDGPRSVTAIFDAPMATLNLTVLGLAGHKGTLRSQDGSVTCSGSCPDLLVPASSVFTLLAQAAAPSTFAGWTSGPCKGTDSTCTFPLADTVSITATFGPQSYMFVTSTTVVPGKLGGVDAADTQCRMAAERAGLPGSYAAWLSTSAVAANQRVGGGGWIRTDGRPFAHDLNSLTDPSYLAVLYPPRLDEYGSDLGNVRIPVATGSGADGSRTGTQCGDYTTTSGALSLGDASSGSATWTSRSLDSSGCANPQRLYCFRSDLDAGLIEPAPQPGRRVFVTSAPFVLGNGLSPNQACRNDPQAGGISDAALLSAFVATSGASAISLVNLDGPPWMRPDGVFIVDQTAHLASGKLLAPVDAVAHSSGGGPNGVSGSLVWTGARDPGSVGTATCGDWTGSMTTIQGLAGDGTTSSSPDWFDVTNTTCGSTSTRLMCIER